MQKTRKPAVKKVTKAVSNVTLLRASGEHCFWVNNGPVVSDIKELRDAFMSGKITDAQWNYHTGGKGRNDFATWIEHVFRNAALAKKVRAAKTKRSAIIALEGVLKA